VGPDMTKALAVETMPETSQNLCFDLNNNISHAANDEDLLYKEKKSFYFIKS
jgi:hypothetical protein